MKRTIIILIIIGLIFLISCEDKVVESKDITKGNSKVEESKMKNRIAILNTNLGVIKIELFEDKMPITTKNFIVLAEQRFYDNTKFHRVIKGFMIQGGDPLSKDDSKKTAWGTGGPGYTIEDEFVEGLSNTRGTIAMANTGQANSGGSQFFINLINNNFLDFNKQPLTSKHPVFGKVIEGMDVVDKIADVKTGSQDKPVEDVVIREVIIQ